MPTREQFGRKIDHVRRTVLRAPCSPSKSPFPRKFLTKDSNVTAYSAWDIDGRVDTIELQFKELKNMVDDSLTQKRDDDNALELAKTRGTRMTAPPDGC